MRYPRIYAMLRRAGLRPWTAKNVIANAKLGDPYDMQWLRALCKDSIRWAEKTY